ncbi:MAG: threonine synthase [Pyrinomonadaceae bacterium]
MRYFSTNRRSPSVGFREATLLGQPDDKGLFFPESIPRISSDLLELSNAEIAFEVIKPYVGDAIDEESLRGICAETVDFEFPLVKINDNISVLELFHGPTLAFKDVGARFMSRCLRHFGSDRNTVVLVATSGDTGGAVAAGFHRVEGIEVVILYPKGKVSRVQELQLTTLGGNVTAIEVDGVFDDCQAMAKSALADRDIQDKVFLTSANSINIARWLPQQFYYFFALKQWHGDAPFFCVPSGNFGNICAGLLAHASGLPTSGFIAACNANAVVPEFLKTGNYKPQPPVATLSNAMDVGNPSNFVRILELFGREFDELKQNLSAVSITDEQTAATMRDVYDRYGYVLDPHGAVAFRALEDSGNRGVILETAHPIKFESVADILGVAPEVPESISDLFDRPSEKIEIAVDQQKLKEVILSMI